MALDSETEELFAQRPADVDDGSLQASLGKMWRPSESCTLAPQDRNARGGTTSSTIDKASAHLVVGAFVVGAFVVGAFVGVATLASAVR